MSKPNRRGRKPNRIKLVNVYHNTDNIIEGGFRPSTLPDRSLYGPGVYATDKKGSRPYGRNRIKMQINPADLVTVPRGPEQEQINSSTRLREQGKNVRLVRSRMHINNHRRAGNYYILNPETADKGRTNNVPAITGSRASYLRNLLKIVKPSGRRISTPGGIFPIP